MNFNNIILRHHPVMNLSLKIMNSNLENIAVATVIPMLVTDGGPCPRRLLADIDMSISPFPTVSEQSSGLIKGTVHIPCLQDEAEMVKELHISPVLESV
jgi:hypothetical protein